MTELHVRTGVIESQAAFEAWFAGLEPAFSVLEPALVMRRGSQRGAPDGYRGLVEGRIDPGESRIAELRLDWEEGCLHFLAEGAGYVWASHSVSSAFPPTASRGTVVAPITDLVVTREKTFWRTSGELSRFASGGRSLAGGPPARVVRYQRGPHLVAWWFQPLTLEAS